MPRKPPVRHYVSNYEKEDGTKVSSYYSGSRKPLAKFVDSRGVPTYLDPSLQDLERQSAEEESIRYEEETARLKQEKEERDEAIRDFYSGEMANALELLEAKLDELKRIEDGSGEQRIKFYRDLIEELRRKEEERK